MEGAIHHRPAHAQLPAMASPDHPLVELGAHGSSVASLAPGAGWRAPGA